MTRWWSSWRLALRLAARDAMRAKARSVLVLVMITLPVLAVTTAAVLYATDSVNGKESLDRRLGTVAAASVTPVSRGRVEQGPDPEDGIGTSIGKGRAPHAPTLADVHQVLGDRPTTTVEQLTALVDTTAGRAVAKVYELDATDPLAHGLFRLTSGHWPTSPDEVVVNQSLLGRGHTVGGTLRVGDDADAKSVTVTIVGVAESSTLRTQPVIVAPPAAFDASLAQSDRDVSWLVGGSAVSWPQVQALNARGAAVLSREVVLHPPAGVESQFGGGSDTEYMTVLALVVAMVLIEVVLLAGPAFAVGARRQSRALALIAASGGAPRQSRRVVLASGVVLGAVGAVIGVAAGVAAARLGTPIVQQHSDTWIGPFDVPWTWIAGVAAFGVLSALLAAVVPAWIASRQDVVAVLAGRRGDVRVSRTSPVIGVLVLGIGAALAWYGAAGRGGELVIAVSAIVCVLGMLFVVPVVVVGVARLARDLPLPLRFAVRDAARHRSRTVPAVAAVAATVAGVVALSISTSSDEQESRATYQAQLPHGTAMVTHDLNDVVDWPALQRRVEQYVPGADVTPVRGLDVTYPNGDWADVQIPGPVGWEFNIIGTAGASVVVGTRIPDFVDGISDADQAAAQKVLANDGAVLFGTEAQRSELTNGPRQQPADGVVRIKAGIVPSGKSRATYTRVSVPARFVDVGDRMMPVMAVVAPATAKRLHLKPVTAALYVSGATIDSAAEQNIREAANAAGSIMNTYVERGYVAPASVRAVRWILALLGLALMLGGTLTATYLSLADARPDLATLSAVGARLRVRRLVSGGYALSVAVVGALLGALVGCIPGIAISYPLTEEFSNSTGLTRHYLDIPWLQVVLVVVALPIAVALFVAATTRSRLPLTRRLD